MTSSSFRPLAGIMLYSPLPSKRGRWRAVRAGGGACSGCDFLTLEMRGSFIAPLPPLRGPPPPLWQGRLGFVRSVPLRGCGFEIIHRPLRRRKFSRCFRPLAEMMLYLPPPSKRGRWRAVRAGGGACSGCDFLTLEMRGSFIAPLPPLRGPPPPLWQGRLGFARSVPLRGCGFKMESDWRHGSCGGCSFRPLAGMWF